MSVSAAVAGKTLVAARDELLRIWRLARAAAHPEVFPGLLDGVMGSFFEAAGRLLTAGAEPEEAISALAGVVRDVPGAPAIMDGEWAVAMEVLGAACEAMEAEPAVGSWLARAIAEADRTTARLAEGKREGAPASVLAVEFMGPLAPARRQGAA